MAVMMAVDVVVLTILALATLRGFFLGLVRETFSIAALVGAFIAARLGTTPLAALLAQHVGPDWSPLALRALAGGVLVVGVLACATLAGRVARRGVRWVGLGWVDRFGGGVLGAAEGTLVGALVISGALLVFGRDDPRLSGSRSLHVYEEIRAQLAEPPDVAAAPSTRHR